MERSSYIKLDVLKIEPYNKQQGPTVQHRELYSISCDNP